MRHELDLAFGNIAGLERPLPPDVTAELVIAALVSADSELAGRDQVTTADLVRNGIWWPKAGSSQEPRAFVEDYGRGSDAVGEPNACSKTRSSRRTAKRSLTSEGSFGWFEASKTGSTARRSPSAR